MSTSWTGIPSTQDRSHADQPSITLPGVLLGIGLGGFFDGIVVHQILQWHHMASELFPPTNVANIELNTTLDGLFHLAAWVVTLAGAALMWRAMGTTRARPAGRLFVGGL